MRLTRGFGSSAASFDVRERKLVVNEPEQVRDLFRRFAEHGSAARLVRELTLEVRTTKAWVTQGGRASAPTSTTTRWSKSSGLRWRR